MTIDAAVCAITFMVTVLLFALYMRLLARGIGAGDDWGRGNTVKAFMERQYLRHNRLACCRCFNCKRVVEDLRSMR